MARAPDHIMPIRHDVHRAGAAAFPTHQAPADARPRLILRQDIAPHIDNSPIALSAAALDRASDMPVGKPFRRTAGRKVAGPFGVSARSHATEDDRAVRPL